MSENDLARISAQLENHGVTDFKNLDERDLIELYKKVVTEWTNDFIAKYNSKNVAPNRDIDADSNIKSALKDSSDLYATLRELLQKYSYSEIHESIINSAQSEVLDRLLIMLEITYFAYQEIIIENIESKINFMPIEEIASFMSFIEIHRDEMNLLKNILNQLENTQTAKKIEFITNSKKYILGNFLASDLEKNYKQFYNKSEDKIALIARLNEISNAYSKKQLDDMTKEDLMELLNSIRQQEIDEKKDNEDFEKYSALFLQALYSDDNDAFNSLAVQVIEDVSDDCLNRLKSHLKNKDPLFESKFLAAQKEWNKFK